MKQKKGQLSPILHSEKSQKSEKKAIRRVSLASISADDVRRIVAKLKEQDGPS